MLAQLLLNKKKKLAATTLAKASRRKLREVGTTARNAVLGKCLRKRFYSKTIPKAQTANY